MAPLTVLTGFLGVGKTTAILHLARQRPPEERWVVLVNEFGEVGIDGALLADDGTLAVRELAGGCLCCAGDAPFQITLQRALDTLQPDRILLEPTGLAEAGRIVDTLRQPPFSERIALRATIGLVDPRHLSDARLTRRADWRSQIEIADVLVANRCDLASPADLQAFLAFAADLYPPKRQILTTTEGRLDAALLDLDPRALPPPPPDLHAHAHHPHHGLHETAVTEGTGALSPQTVRRLTRRQWAGPDFTTCGWQLPPEQVVPLAVAEQIVAQLRASPAVLRIKGVLQTDRGWRSVQADVDGVRWQPSAWRTDSRLEVIAATAHAADLPDWDRIEAALRG